MREPKSILGGEQYEFTGGQSAPIRDLASKMRFVGAFLFIVGALQCAMILIIGVIEPANLGAISNVITGVIYIILGVYTRRAAEGFRKVVSTKGRDITHLMSALRSLRSLYQVQFFLLILAIILSGTLMVLLILP